jgi:hypothetical protein
LTKLTPHRTYRFGVLLATLLVLLAGYGLLDYMQKLLPSKVVFGGSALLLSFVLFAAVVNVRGARWTLPMWAMRGLAVITMLVLVLGATLDSQGVILVARALAILCIGYTIIVLLEFLTQTTRVDSNAIYASLCVYLLMSIAWALWYSLLYFLEPGSFGEGHDLATFGERAMVGELYYSLVTLTTLGYGDVAPLSTAARMSAALEAVIGQVYVVILVAKLVGLNVSQTMTDTET